jgi:hypothetical protein
MDILSVILLVTLVVTGFLVYNLYNKVYRQEVIIESQIEYLRNVSSVIVESKLYIDKLDEKGIFRADDEVGVFFNFMKEIQENINSYRLPENYGKRKE